MVSINTLTNIIIYVLKLIEFIIDKALKLIYLISNNSNRLNLLI